MRERDGFFDSFFKPIFLEEYHLFAFIFQLVVMIIVAIIIVNARQSYDDLVSDSNGNIVVSVFDRVTNKNGDERKFYPFRTKSKEEREKLDKLEYDGSILDMDNGGLWLTNDQYIIYGCWAFTCGFSGLIFTVAGVGNLFHFIRFYLGLAIKISLGFFLLLPLLLVLLVTYLIFLTLVLMCIAPFFISLHLILGIIQTIIIIKNKRQGANP